MKLPVLSTVIVSLTLLLVGVLGNSGSIDEDATEDLLLITVATRETDSFKRFIRSAGVYELNATVLGMGKSGPEFDADNPGASLKLLKDELAKHQSSKNLVVLFTDGTDAILLAGKDKILGKFKTLAARVVFGAENVCLPDPELGEKYPEIEKGYRFLNSKCFIGFATDLYRMLSDHPVATEEDVQLYFTKLYLDQSQKYNLKVDHSAEIFQNLNGATSDVKLKLNKDEPYIKNSKYATVPAVLQGNGFSRRLLNFYGNYLARSWSSKHQCLSCREDTIIFDSQREVPHLMIAVFIEKPTPFLEEFFILVSKIEYPKDKIDLFIHNSENFHVSHVDDFIKKANNATSDKYHSIKSEGPEAKLSERDARNRGIELCLKVKCDFYLSLDGEAHLRNRAFVKLLISQNRNVIAPMLLRPFTAKSNFWGAMNSKEQYSTSSDYKEIVQNHRKGLWNVPYISSAYLIKGTFIHNNLTRPNFTHGQLDADQAFCKNMRDKGDFFYVSNMAKWGHLVSTENFNTSHTNAELWEIANNRLDWEQRYLHPNYSHSLSEGVKIQSPCPDVFWFPIVSERFADDLVDVMEASSKWSEGSNIDSRFMSAYEAAPTRDIQMYEIGYQGEWLQFLNTYVRPLQERVIKGHTSYPSVQAGMNFVVRYKSDEQPSLFPHKDTSAYTINIALNHAGIDFEGGGCRFTEYNCTIRDTQKGWMLLHRGELVHEGLHVTKGTRYIMVSFVDP